MTGELQHDHVNASRLLDEIDFQVERIGSGGRADYERLGDIMRYMTEYGDRVHHPKEELIFTLLLARNPAAASLIETLHAQHEQLAVAASEALRLLRAIASGAIVERSRILHELSDYSALLRQHMQLEELRVFPLARALLCHDDWSTIERQRALRPDPLFGERLEDSYRDLYSFISRRA